MMKENFAFAEQHLINGFADHVVEWAIEAGAPQETCALLHHVAVAVCAATTEGHVCINLNRQLPDTDDWREPLLNSGVIGTPSSPGSKPLILDEDARLYLHRYYDYEHRLAKRLRLALSAEITRVPEMTRARLNAFFGSLPADNRADWPRLAAALALQRKLVIISGGPGTGKTTAIVHLLACLLEDHHDCRIALAAPTGKAAARMQETIRSRASHLPASIQERLPTESFTVHRLLGVLPNDGSFYHNANRPLPIDALVIDEASMLDIALAAQLFEAVPEHARIILLGDKDQLSAVEAGAVFSELSADPTLTPDCIGKLAQITGLPTPSIVPPAPRMPTPLHNAVIWFSENHRFDPNSGIGRLARHVCAGEADASLALLHEGDNVSLRWVDDVGNQPSAQTHAIIQEEYAAYLEAVVSKSADRQSIFQALDRFRILCAIKEGPRGVDAMNRLVDHHVRAALKDSRYAHERTIWYPGRPVIIQRNDYALKLFNGDIGIALHDTSDPSKRLMVYFPDREQGFRAIAPSRLPEHETAYAITVHKSQGSEFDSILLMMPEQPNRVVTRELLYTAITRARRLATLSSNENVLRRAIASPMQRDSGLIRQLQSGIPV